MIRLAAPSIEDDDLEAVREALASGFLVQGPRVARFERLVAERVGVKNAVATCNCTSALHLALLSLDVRPGDTCLVTAYSWVATANVIETCGARPVFVDIDPVTFNIDLNQLEQVLGRMMADRDSAPRVKAVLPVHAFGQMAEMDELNGICGRWNLPVVEDAACALGASLRGKGAGIGGTMGCFSFHPRKAITTGEGGMLVSNDDQLVRRVRALRNHGLDPDTASPDFIMPGYNYRMTEFQAALGAAQMKKLSRIIAARQQAALRYDQLLAGGPLQSPKVMAGASHVYQSYVTLLPTALASRRGEIIRRAKEAGIETQIGTVHMPLTTYYSGRYGYQRGDFPCTDAVSARSLTLPLFEKITAEEQGRVVETVLNIIG
jgi:dTDP-4-amino-4,6-dideoxygalactose transaminase